MELDQDDELLDHTLLDEEPHPDELELFHCDDELYQLDEELGPIDEELEYHVDDELGQYEELLGQGKLDDDIQRASKFYGPNAIRKEWSAWHNTFSAKKSIPCRNLQNPMRNGPHWNNVFSLIHFS